MKEIKLTKKFLKKEYIKEKKSSLVIAREVNCYKSTILRKLHKYNIPVRSNAESFNIYSNKDKKINLNQKIMEFLDGELLGDGGYYPRSQFSASFQIICHSKKYLQWINKILDKYEAKQSGNIIKFRSKGMLGYTYRTLTYNEFICQRKRWYPNGYKIIPKILKLTPIVVRQWYIGDGSLKKNIYGHQKSYITLATCAFSNKDIKRLMKQLEKIGLKVTSSMNKYPIIRISNSSVKNFLSYIGKCPQEIKSIYGYKWRIK